MDREKQLIKTLTTIKVQKDLSEHYITVLEQELKELRENGKE